MINENKALCHLCGKKAKELNPLGAYIKIDCSNCNEVYGITQYLYKSVLNKDISSEDFKIAFYKKKKNRDKLRDLIIDSKDF